MLEVFRQFFERRGAPGIPCGGEFREYRQRGMLAAQFLLDQRRVPQRAEHQIVGQAAIYCLAKER